MVTNRDNTKPTIREAMMMRRPGGTYTSLTEKERVHWSEISDIDDTNHKNRGFKRRRTREWSHRLSAFVRIESVVCQTGWTCEAVQTRTVSIFSTHTFVRASTILGMIARSTAVLDGFHHFRFILSGVAFRVTLDEGVCRTSECGTSQDMLWFVNSLIDTNIIHLHVRWKVIAISSGQGARAVRIATLKAFAGATLWTWLRETPVTRHSSVHEQIHGFAGDGSTSKV